MPPTTPLVAPAVATPRRPRTLRLASIDGPSVLAIFNTLAQSEEATDFPERQLVAPIDA